VPDVLEFLCKHFGLGASLSYLRSGCSRGIGYRTLGADLSKRATQARQLFYASQWVAEQVWRRLPALLIGIRASSRGVTWTAGRRYWGGGALGTPRLFRVPFGHLDGCVQAT
jgi:hypothetical protein